MGELSEALSAAWRLLATGDPELLEIAARSLYVSLLALLLACAVGLPTGAALALLRFRGRRGLGVVLNTLMGLPPVVVGLGVYLVLSRSGPLGFLGLLFTTEAMILAQFVLITPIVAALSRQAFETLWTEYGEQLRSLGAGPWRAMPTLLVEGRDLFLVAILAGLGRGIAEVGAVLIVGGNIAHATRVMTTAIALEANRGDLALALGLGMILLLLSFLLNATTAVLRRTTLHAG